LGESCNGRCWYILWTFGLVHGNLGYFSRFGYFVQRKKNGNPAAKTDATRYILSR
jgi:hypothetical protein